MPKSVLFVCDDNAILGPMAETFLNRHGWSVFKAYSAGIWPQPIHLYTFRVMEEIGCDLYGNRSKSIFEFNYLPYVDYLITLTDDVNDPFVYNANHIGERLHWPFRKPSFASEQTASIEQARLPEFTPLATLSNYWLTPESPETSETSDHLQVSTRHKVNTIVHQTNPGQPKKEMQDILKQYRRIRDEMECQVMNWLEEQGLGPFWWHG